MVLFHVHTYNHATVLFTVAESETESDNNNIIIIPVFIAIIVVLLSGAVITVVAYIRVKKYRKQARKKISVTSGEMTIQSHNNYSSASPSDAPTIVIEKGRCIGKKEFTIVCSVFLAQL